MTRVLQRIGNSRGLVMTRTMLDHLGVSDAVEVTLEEGRIVITPARGAAARRESFEEARDATFAEYDDTLRRLSEPG